MRRTPVYTSKEANDHMQGKHKCVDDKANDQSGLWESRSQTEKEVKKVEKSLRKGLTIPWNRDMMTKLTRESSAEP